MLVRVPNDNEKFFYLLKEAVMKNTVRPRPEEESKMTVSRLIRCSPEIEGDSQLAIVLFCGMAEKLYGIPPSEIIDHLGIEPEEHKYKVNKFWTNIVAGMKLKPLKNKDIFQVMSSREFDLRKLVNKVRLINNYIAFYAKKHSVIFYNKQRLYG